MLAIRPMDNDIKALRSGVWYTVANFLTKAIGFITTPIFSRMLTHAEFGIYDNYLSWLSILTIFVTLNLESTFISARFDFEDDFDRYVFSVLTLSTVSAMVWIGIYAVFSAQAAAFLNLNNVYIRGMLIYLIFLPAVNIFQTKERYFYHYKLSVLVSCLITVSTAALSVGLVMVLPNRLDGRVLGSVIPTIVVGAGLYLYHLVKGKRVHLGYWKYALTICFPFIPHLLSLTLLNSTDRIMITDLCGEEYTAVYGMAYSCGAIITVLITALNTAFAPWLGEKLHENKMEDIRRVSYRYVLLFLYLTVGVILLGPEIILILGGKSYAQSVYIMPPILFGCMCQFLYAMFVNVEQFKRKTVGMAFASMTAAAINYVLNYIFIRRFGYTAAAYTTAVSYLVLLLIHMLLVRQIGYADAYDYRFIGLIALLMGAVTVGTNWLYQWNILRLLLVLLYISAFLLLVIRNRELLLRVIKRG